MSDEASVMGVEQRGWIKQSMSENNFPIGKGGRYE